METGQSEPSRSTDLSREQTVRFGVCAFIDLLGFSSHLETSGYDLRTSIVEQAILRLNVLERGLELMRAESAAAPSSYPEGLAVQRINDAIICTMDLDDVLLPPVGERRFSGMSVDELDQLFDLSAIGSPEELEHAHTDLLREAVEPIRNFVGLVGRLHLFIRKAERDDLFPGARTVISTGFRRPFTSAKEKDDHLSANFAFANAVVADNELHGPHFFVENSAIELCSRDSLANNLFQFACFEWREADYDCLRHDPPRQGVSMEEAVEISEPIRLQLFRQPYVFRRLNPCPLSYLQHIAFMRPCIDGTSPFDESHPFFKHLLSATATGMTPERVRSASPPRSFLYGGSNDLGSSVVEFHEMLETGESPTRRVRKRREEVEAAGHPELIDNPEYLTAIEELESEEVDIDIELLPAEGIADSLFELGEEAVTALRPLLGGDLSALDFPSDEHLTMGDAEDTS